MILGPMKGENFSVSPTKFTAFDKILDNRSICTVCRAGLCPNRSECFKKKQLAFMILGEVCTRSCKFCGVSKGIPKPVDFGETIRIARLVKELGLRYVVITSVARDDLKDGGSSHFSNVCEQVRSLNPGVRIELLIPDFNFDLSCLNKIIACSPFVINHNIECCESVFSNLRSQGNYKRSLRVLSYLKSSGDQILIKSGFMLGVGESLEDIQKTLKDLRGCGVDIVTVGQYLPPTKSSFFKTKDYSQEEFEDIQKFALKLGFRHVFCGRNVRSSYFAESQIL